MFPLAGKNLPSSGEELERSIHDALAEVFALRRDDRGVSVSGGKFPSIKALKIDLDDATVSARKPPPKPVGTGKRTPGPKVEKLELSAQPLKYERAKLNLKLSAAGLQFEFDRDRRGNPVLVLTDARSGKVDARITKVDLEALVREVATLAARQHGITIQDLELELESTGKRSVAAEVRVKAKKMVMSGVVHVTGQLDIDDELNATLSNLSISGDGVIGKTAAGFLRKKIREYDGTKIPLMAFSLGEVSLRDLKIDVKDDLRVTAAFGAA